MGNPLDGPVKTDLARRRESPGALETIETAVHLLRTAPMRTLAAYYLGALPFVLGLLFFWADMSRSPFAAAHAALASLGMAGLFAWLKFWQSVFARHLRAQLCRETPPPLTLARAARIFHTQTALQTTALFVLPLAMIPALPFPWLYAFYQNLTVQADTGEPTLRATVARAWRQARLWPSQNHVVLTVMSLFSLFIFTGLAITSALLPELIKMLFGVETVFTRGGTAMLNTTFFTAMLGVAYLCVDPILKSCYVVRVFHGESLRSGEDLRAALKVFNPRPGSLVALVLIGLTLAGAVGARAQTANPSPTVTESLPPQELNRAIDEVIQQRKFTWRLPRERVVASTENEPGIIAKFFQSVGRLMRDAVSAVGRAIEKILRRIFGRFGPAPGTPGYGWILSKQMLLYGLLAVVVSAIAVLLLRFWKRRQPEVAVATALAAQPVPDVADENVGAEQLPEDGWTSLARELLGRGEFRLALRAFYLASLAHLADRNLVSLARFKSNRDYERELQRRAHAFPDLQTLFGENVSCFDRVWYGRHEVTGELVTRFATNVERIKAGG